MKLLILGNARHGKDTLAELFQEHFGLTFMSSSQASADFFLYDQLKDKYGYNSPEECFNDRVNHRDEWYLAICDYNKDNRARLATDILSKTDCYVGMRDKAEFDECVNQKFPFQNNLIFPSCLPLLNYSLTYPNVSRICFPYPLYSIDIIQPTLIYIPNYL